jgi:hypothetical protein
VCNRDAGIDDWADNIILLRAPGDDTKFTVANSEWAQTLMEALEGKNGKKDEILFCQRARLCALKGDPEGALRVATECSAAPGISVRLRTYTPALAAYASKGVTHAM